MNRKTLKKIKIIIVLLIPFAVQTPNAQETCNLSRCITTGLEQNFSIKIANNEEEITRNNYSKGNAGYLPSVSTTNRFGGTLNSTNQSIRGGGENDNNGVHNISGSANVNLDLTIFRGFSVQTTYQKLNELKQIGELNTQMDMENLASEIISEYFYYIQQLNLYENMKYAVELSGERVRIDEQRYLLGSSSKLELLQSVVYLNADSSILSKQNEVLRASQIRLKKLMASSDLEESIIPEDTSIHINQNLKYADLLESTLKFNTALSLAAKNREISELDYKIISARAYPYLNLSSGYTYSYNKYETGTYTDQRVHGMNYGLTLGMDIFDGYQRRREKTNAMIDIETKKYQYLDIEQEVKADLLTVFYAYENNLRLMQLEEQNLEVARENLGIALERYKLGDLSGLELREVQKSLLDAEERLISVKYQTKLAEISLMQISGRIMDYI
jgi:outer membrane protein TolC